MKFERELILNVSSKEACSILNGNMTALLRKNLPKNFKEGWVYLYCTKSGKGLYKEDEGFFLFGKGSVSNGIILNGKVVARFWFDDYTIFEYTYFWDETTPKNADNDYWSYRDIKNRTNGVFLKDDAEILAKLCMTYNEVVRYNKFKRTYDNSTGRKILYAWHIKQLEIFDTPKELKDFYTQRIVKRTFDILNNRRACIIVPIKETKKLVKAPQSWQYVYSQEEK